jgi:hypothetical protein
MSRTRFVTALFIIPLLALLVPRAAAALDATLENLDISGTLRLRAWQTGSQVKVPGKFPPVDGYSSVNYEDMFFRNRFDLTVLPNLRVRAVFDISSVFGKNDFAMGRGGTNLVTRDVYAVFTPTANSEVSIGLQPFSLQGGYILARDASGIQYNHHLFARSVKLYAGFVKAFDDADSSYGDNTAPPKYADDNVYFAGATLNVSSVFFCDFYYVYEHDRYTDTEDGGTDNRKSSLHWAGIHNKLLWRNWIFRAGGIVNRGRLYLDPGTGSERTDVSAWLFEFETGYRFSGAQVSLVAEGASGDPNNPEAGTSFQDIKASHEFSYIVVDNYGGLSLRGSGESSWYGLYGAGCRAQFTLMETVNMEVRLVHFRTTRALAINGNSSTWLGDEADFRAEYVYQEALSIFLAAGVFRPRTAYFALESVGDDSGGYITEVMLGAQVTY